VENKGPLSKRELLKLSGAASAGAIAASIGLQSLDRHKKPSGGLDEQMEIGSNDEISFEQVTPVTYFQTEAAIEQILNETATHIRFDKETGDLSVVGIGGDEIASLPRNRQIRGVFVSTDDFSLSFEYAGADGLNFGVRIGRSIKDGHFVAASWDTNSSTG
jgi:hypothetical protein